MNNPEHNARDDALIQVVGRLADMVDAQRLKEQRETRWQRFKIFIVLAIVALPLAIYAAALVQVIQRASDDHVALVRLEGTVGGMNRAATQRVRQAIESALNNRYSSGLVLSINSPGGSAAQAELVRETLNDLRARHPGKRIIAVGEDSVASAAYLIASGADEIYVMPSTLVGSIGVIYQHIGVRELLERMGVEVNTMVTGDYKDVGSMYRDWNERDEFILEGVLEAALEQFRQYVIDGRSERLDLEAPDLWTGRVWTGREAMRIGLVDGIATREQVLAEHFAGLRTKEYGRVSAWDLVHDLGVVWGAMTERLRL